MSGSSEIAFHRKRITNVAMHLQIPAFSRKMCRGLQSELDNSPQIPACSHTTVPRFAGSCKSPGKAPDVFCSKTHPLMHWSFAGSESTEFSRVLQQDIPLQHPQSSRCCPILYTDKSSFVSLSCFLNPEACVILVTLRFTWISSFLATRGRYALVMLGRAVGVSSVPSR